MTDYHLFPVDHIHEYITVKKRIYIGCDRCIYSPCPEWKEKCSCNKNNERTIETTTCKICEKADERIIELQDELDEVTYFLGNIIKKTYLVDNDHIKRINEIAVDLNRLNRLKLYWNSKPIENTVVVMVNK